MQYSNSTLEYRLLAALRSERNMNRIFNISGELFTDDREALFSAYVRAIRTYGNTGIDSLEASYGKSVPDEIYIPIDTDIDPLLDTLDKLKRRRDMLLLADVAQRASKEDSPDIDSIRLFIDRAYKPKFATDGMLQSGIASFAADFGRKVRGDYKFLSTGLRFLDSMMGGEWNRSEVTLITGKTGGGKSALMGSSALAMAENGDSVCILSHEMKKSELVSRWVSGITGIDNAHIRAGKISLTKPLADSDIAAIDQAMNHLDSLPLYVIDDNSLSFGELLSLIQYYHDTHGVNTFFVDYLQRMPFDTARGKHYGLSDNLIALCDIAKKYNLAIIILAQKHDDGKIRDCGDADKHVACWLDLELDQDSLSDTGIISAIIEFFKNRHGRLGKHPVLYSSKILKFVGSVDHG